MSALPIFDESRGEFVERHAETKPPTKPDARRAPAVCESRAAPKERAAHSVARMPSEPTERLAFLRAYLERMQRRFDDSGKFVDAEIVGELLAVLGGRQAVRAPRRQSDQSAIH